MSNFAILVVITACVAGGILLNAYINDNKNNK